MVIGGDEDDGGDDGRALINPKIAIEMSVKERKRWRERIGVIWSACQGGVDLRYFCFVCCRCRCCYYLLCCVVLLFVVCWW